ncbi:quinone oxidoreductase family protein [Actinomadura miaoliensis]|uniref:Zinc-binding dehydrogenase n=1 Tax=Actinomadura miaoliensis TaxID=430685 RepID=A0ABP7X4M4_9ACTN
MRTVRFHQYGGPEVLRAEQVPTPEPGEGELLVEVDAIGVTLPVVRLTHGSPEGAGVPLPHTPGGEIVGRVAAIGPSASGWQIGQRVTGLAFSGAYAEYAAVSAAFMTPVPDAVDDHAALLVSRSGQVAWGALHAGGFAKGDSVLVTAAAGGVGHLAVQLAVALGASRVVAAVGDVAKAEFVRELGADHVVTYDQDDWGDPVDIVLDGVGGEVQASCLRALAPLGRLVSFNGVGGQVDVNELRMRGTAVIGFAMAHLAGLRRDVYERHQRELWRLHIDGRLRPAVHASFPLEDAAEAHRVIEARANRGKVVLVPR